MNKYLQSIAEEKDGFSFGESWRFSEDSLVSLLPILRKTSKKRNYLILSESDNVDIRDTGNINKVEVHNKGTKPVYIRMGEIFSGKTQERTAIRSYVIMPKEKVQVEVRCVHASRGISMDAEMKTSGIVPSSLDANFSTASFKMRGVEQGAVWKNVESISACMAKSIDDVVASFSSSISASTSDMPTSYSMIPDDLARNMDKFGETINHILEKVPYFDNQVGISTFDLKGVTGIECFDLKGSWKAMRDAIIKKEGENLSKEEQDSPFEYKKTKALRSVKKVLKLDYEERPVFKSKDYFVVALKGDGYIGELVELNGNIIHFVITRK